MNKFHSFNSKTCIASILIDFNISISSSSAEKKFELVCSRSSKDTDKNFSISIDAGMYCVLP